MSYDLATGQTSQFVLHAALGGDDHDAAGIMIRPDGRYLAVYTRHNADKTTYYRVSANPHDATSWMPEQSFNWAATPNSDFNVTYSNLFYLSAEDRTYNFARANNRSPNMMISGNGGTTWTYGGKLVNNPVNVGYVNGYFKYASNGVDRIDFIGTEHHPRDFNNSIYHGYIQGGQMFRSDGTLVDADIFDNVAPNQTSLTQVFASDPEDGNQVYSRLDHGPADRQQRKSVRNFHGPIRGRPRQHQRIQRPPVLLRTLRGQWNVHELAKAGARLYPNEQDYTGLVALDPSDPDILYMSTTIDPRDDADLGVHEIFKGVTGDSGENWTWTPITFNSTVDNLRPIVPIWDDEHTALVWMQGTYYSQVNYDMQIVGLTEFGPLVGELFGDLNLDGVLDPLDIGQFFTYLHTNLSGLTEAEAKARGDMNGDFQNNYADFVLFQKAYEDENGPGSFAAVPEPGSLVLSLIATAFSVLAWRRGKQAMR